MNSLILTMLVVVVIASACFFICFIVARKSSVESPSGKSISSWECDTCGNANPFNWQTCQHCGMDKTD
jgi:hypothetical protein